MKWNLIILAGTLLAGVAVTLPAQPVIVLRSFTNSPDGASPYGGLLAAGGMFYGTTQKGGSADAGTVFALNPDGTGYTALYSFTNTPDGAQPMAGLAWADGTLYGVTPSGGANEVGTVFTMNTNGGNYAVLYNFNGSSGGYSPASPPVLSGNTLYGTAESGPWGTVYALSTNGGNFTPLHTFTTPHGTPLTNADGEQPHGGVILSDGMLYGTAYGGGTNGYGTVYSLSTNGNNFAVLHAFSNSPDGSYPQGGLVAAGGRLYGTTETGGSNRIGTVFAINADGSGYSILHHFATNGPEGADPWGTLTLSGRTLYGTTKGGGSGGNDGVVFSLHTDGTGFLVLHNFTNNPDGASPLAGVVLCGGQLYGTTEQGGSSSWGTVFSLPPPAPTITNLQLAGTNLVLTVVNGVAGDTNTVWMGTNLALPLSQWTPVATNVLGANGGFSVTATNAVSPGAPQQFYLLQTQ